MPLYEYRCRECDTRFTRTEPMSEHVTRRRPECPKCHSPDAEPVFSDFFAKTVRKS